jgi:hypothetical protein
LAVPGAPDEEFAMGTAATRAEAYRARAEELRTIAEGLKSKEREFLLQLAGEYEDMAANAETLERDRYRV